MMEAGPEKPPDEGIAMSVVVGVDVAVVVVVVLVAGVVVVGLAAARRMAGKSVAN